MSAWRLSRVELGLLLTRSSDFRYGAEIYIFFIPERAHVHQSTSKIGSTRGASASWDSLSSTDWVRRYNASASAAESPIATSPICPFSASDATMWKTTPV